MLFVVGFNITDRLDVQLVARLRATIRHRLDKAVEVQCSFPDECSVEPDRPVVLLVSLIQGGGQAATRHDKVKMVQQVADGIHDVLPGRSISVRLIIHRLQAGESAVG